MHLAVLCRENDLRRNAADVDLFGLQHADRQTGRDAGIDGIAAGLEDFEGRVGGQVMAGRNDVPGAHDGHAFCCHTSISGSCCQHAANRPLILTRAAALAPCIVTDWTLATALRDSRRNW